MGSINKFALTNVAVVTSVELCGQRQEKPRRKPAKAPSDKPITHDAMLLEAAFTEIHNSRSLAQLLAREEAVMACTPEKAWALHGARHLLPAPPQRRLFSRSDFAHDLSSRC
jgi:hypothetical protein